MARLFLSLLTLMIFASCSLTPKQVHEMSESDLDQELLVLSGVEEDLQMIPEVLKHSFEKKAQAEELDPKTAEALYQSMKKAFEPEAMIGPVKEALTQNMNKEEKRQVIYWYQSKLGKKVRGLELHAESEQGQKEFKAWIEKIHSGDVEVERNDVVFARDVALYSGAVSMAVDTVSSVAVGTLVGLNSTLPEEKRLSFEQLNEQIVSIKQHLAEALTPSILLNTIYAYRALSPEERYQVVSFLKEGAGHKFVDVIGHAVRNSVELASVKVGKQLGRSVASQKSH